MDTLSLTYSINNISSVAARVLAAASPQKIFLFYGEMGAGKTTLIKALCQQLGINGQVSSPTFAIVNEYSAGQDKVFHFDFYRLKNETEALDMGYEEYFFSGRYCFVEWPEKIPNLLPPSYEAVRITVVGDTIRQLVINKN